MNKQKITAARFALVAACLLLSGCGLTPKFGNPQTVQEAIEVDCDPWFLGNDLKVIACERARARLIQKLTPIEEKGKTEVWACAEGHSCR